jgi:hypothetical protein
VTEGRLATEAEAARRTHNLQVARAHTGSPFFSLGADHYARADLTGIHELANVRIAALEREWPLLG